jgi:hypothetical protein
VTGTVRDETGRAVREALVVLDAETTPMRARTGADGRFRIQGVPAGSHELQVVRIGFRPHRSTIAVPENGIDVSVTLEQAPLLLDTVAVRVSRTGIHGVVTTRGISLLPHAPRPLRGAIVEVLDSPYRTTTAADGRFSVGAAAKARTRCWCAGSLSSRVLSVYVPPDGGVT